MRKIFGWMIVSIVFLAGGCATSNVPKRVAQGAAFGAALGYVMKGSAGAKVGAAAGAAIGTLGGAIEDEVDEGERETQITSGGGVVQSPPQQRAYSPSPKPVAKPNIWSGIFKTRQPQVVLKVLNGLERMVIIRYTDTFGRDQEIRLGMVGQKNIVFVRQYLTKPIVLTASVMQLAKEGERMENLSPVGTTTFSIKILSRRQRRGDAERKWHITGYTPLRK